MDPHRIGEARSLAYHRIIATRLLAEPALLEQARRQNERALAMGGRSMSYARAWQELLDGPLPLLVELMVEESERATALRSCGPFAGMLEPRQRWRLWREVRARLEGTSI